MDYSNNAFILTNYVDAHRHSYIVKISLESDSREMVEKVRAMTRERFAKLMQNV